MKRKETLTALLFLCGLTGGLLLLVTSFFGGEGHLEAAIRGVVQDPGTLSTFLVSAESAANQDLDRSHTFIELYGGIQRLTGRRILVDMADPEYTVVRLEDGTLAFQNLTVEPVEQADNADSVAALKEFVENTYNLPFLYVQAPQKVVPEELPAGMRNYGNENADQLLAELEQRGVDTFDLRPGISAAQAATDQSFYFCTDHHWTPLAGFTAYQLLSGELNNRYDYTADARFTAPAQYDITTYEDWFLGSQGKRVGTQYAGLDSIDLWSPMFDTNFTYSAFGFFEDRNGTFDQTLLFPERLEPKDYYSGNPYTLYSGGDYPLGRMINHNNPDGPRVLLIRDSFSCAMAPFLALQCGELMTMDMRYFKDDLAGYIDWLRPDLVMVMYSTGSAKSGEMFPFKEMLNINQ